jgi:hypothetical protein
MTHYCGFCGKSQHEVAKLIAGPTVHICDECVDLCHDIVRGKPYTPPKPPIPVEWMQQIETVRATVTSLQETLTKLQLEMLQARFVRNAAPEETGEVIGFGEREPE